MKDTEIEMLEAGPALDALVAEKVMGLELTNYNPIGIRKGGWVLPIPNYSNDIAAAWEVVQKLDLLCGAVMLRRNLDSTVTNYVGTWEVLEIEHELQHVVAVGTTAPLAICRAALKLMEDDDGR